MQYLFPLNLPDFLLDLPEPDPKPYCICSHCGEEIYDGRERVYHLNNKLLCEDCFVYEVMDPDYINEVMDAEALADALDIVSVYAENLDPDEDE